MKQHNAGADRRDCWGSARERERIKARFNIRQRVNNSTSRVGPETAEEASNEVISKYLLYIRRGDRSKFSTTFMDRHFGVLSALHDTQQHILESLETLSETIRLATKLRGNEYALSLEKHIQSLATFSLMEYAVWLGKYSIVSGMLHGGINPCVRGSTFVRFDLLAEKPGDQHQDHGEIQETHHHHQQQQQLMNIGLNVLKRFFNSFPLRLSTYIVQSVVCMRRNVQEVSNSDVSDRESQPLTSDARQAHKKSASFYCPICDATISVDFRLTFRNCNHVFCEMCFWNDMLSNIDTTSKREARNVISCLVCGKQEASDSFPFDSKCQHKQLLEADISHLSPVEKAKLSLENFRRLPANQRELKLGSSKKKRLIEVDHVASNWLEAVTPSLGSTQDVRLDKFQVNVERNAISYIKGCLLAGVDINRTNEYGQTALYVAAWRGNVETVKLLLDYGADPSITANGNSTVAEIYSSVHHQDDMGVLEVFGDHSTRCLEKAKFEDDEKFDNDATSAQSLPGYIELIPKSSNHPGAGACFIENAISSSNIKALLELFRGLPIDTNQKKKKNTAPCSERSYYCDAEGSLRKLIGNAVVRSGLISSAIAAETIDDTHPLSMSLDIEPGTSLVRVFPHMRFLHYTSSGTVLAPHIDLCRVNPFSRPSDKQKPEHRSTHTFILYLTDCKIGGETSLLEEVTADGSASTLAKISPRKGRLLIFPHQTPHEGMEVVDVPKILLRGELQISANT